MKALNLMVDIDEVVFPLGDSIHEIAHEFGLHDNSEPWKVWSAWEQYGCDPDAYWDLWITFAHRNGYTETPPIQHQVEALRHLYFEGHRINLVTARGFMANAENIKRWTPEWLEEYAVPYHTLTFSRDKAAEQAHLGAYDLAVDDSPKNYLALEEAGVNVWLQDHTHNHAFQAEHDPSVVKDLWELVRVAERLA